jgi:hypothetical protein
MDLLDKIQCQPYHLTLEIGEIDCGWMDITLVSNYAFKMYSASCLCNPIHDLLEKYVLLSENQPYPINPFTSILNYAVVEHDLEGGNIVWLLRKKEDMLYVYIWENIDEMEDWLSAEFSEQNYLDQYEEVPNLTKNLIYSLQGKMLDFAKTLCPVLDGLKQKGAELDCSEHWGYQFSDADYQKIKVLLKNEG